MAHRDFGRGLVVSALAAAAFMPPASNEPRVLPDIVTTKDKAKHKRREKNKAARKARRRSR